MSPLGGDEEMNPPFSFRSYRKENGPFTVQREKTPGPNPSLSVRFGQNGGRASRCPRKLIVSYRVRLGLWEQRSASPQLGVWVRLSGWSSNGLFFSFRAPRFAQRCRGRKLRQASARLAERQRRVEAGQIGLATPTHAGSPSRAHNWRSQQVRARAQR